jgi:hypothetical protein
MMLLSVNFLVGDFSYHGALEEKPDTMGEEEASRGCHDN